MMSGPPQPPANPSAQGAGARRDSAAVLERILDVARWAPSGDNSQPWRFEICSPSHVVVHAFDTRRHCVYDLQGHASQLSVGALLETIRIAASVHGLTARTARRRDSPDESPLIDVWFDAVPDGAAADPLHAWILERSVQRRPLSMRALEPAAKFRLEQSVGPGFRIVWFEGIRQRLRMAWLATRSAKIRLTIPEAYTVHRDIIEWNARYSVDRVPDQALGADRVTLSTMRWAMASWDRVRVLNRYFGGTIAPRLQLDLIPGLRCAAHFAIVADRPAGDIDARLSAGAAVQRFWLTTTSLGLQLQPQHTPLVFGFYARNDIPFTSVPGARRRAEAVSGQLRRLLGPAIEQTVFLGRVGAGPPATARSIRLPLERLQWTARDSGGAKCSPISPGAERG
jgi:hypothetical protein